MNKHDHTDSHRLDPAINIYVQMYLPSCYFLCWATVFTDCPQHTTVRHPQSMRLSYRIYCYTDVPTQHVA